MAELNHIAIIPDGNRRWARERNLPTLEGHRRGFSALEKMGKHIRKKGVHTMTVWAFSTENWNRSKDEVSYLMKLYENWLKTNLRNAMKDEVRIVHLGRKDRIPVSLKKQILESEKKTKHFTKHTLGFACDYSGRDEIVRATKKLRMKNEELGNTEDFASYLDTAEFLYPYPDLIIRTSGEFRTSGFMSWQSAYAEWIFHKKYLPDFSIPDLDACMDEYHSRQRRFGK